MRSEQMHLIAVMTEGQAPSIETPEPAGIPATSKWKLIYVYESG
jgi:hypothetical protein